MGVCRRFKSSTFSSCRHTIICVIQPNEPTVSSKSSIFPYAIKDDSVMTRGGMQSLGRLLTATLNHLITRAKTAELFSQQIWKQEGIQDLICPCNEACTTLAHRRHYTACTVCYIISHTVHLFHKTLLMLILTSNPFTKKWPTGWTSC